MSSSTASTSTTASDPKLLTVNQPAYPFSAPLPSPTSTSAPQHFYFPPSSKPQQSTQTAETNHGGLPPSSSQDSSHNSAGQDTSSPLRMDFGLLAEAAKRAQMAVLARDLGEVGL